jgi:hypothetical protein
VKPNIRCPALVFGDELPRFTPQDHLKKEASDGHGRDIFSVGQTISLATSATLTGQHHLHHAGPPDTSTAWTLAAANPTWPSLMSMRASPIPRKTQTGTRMYRYIAPAILVTLLAAGWTSAAERILDAKLHHLRVGAEREWSEFPLQPEGPNLVLRFPIERNAGEWTLRLRQQDVRQTWKVLLNGKELGRLVSDENDMVIYLPVPANWLLAGDNTLLIEQVGKIADDIRVGEIVLHDRPVSQALSEAALEIAVHDAGQPGQPALPCRLTVVNAQGALMTVGASSGKHLAVRSGVLYTGTGQAKFGLPAGEYTIYAGRGFAYGIDSVRVNVKPGDVVKKTLAIRQEVPTKGYVSCDTHVHTLTYSGHGDCTLDERMLTIAGEGIELPIATDHNVQVDWHAAAVKQGVRKYFTPVVGNEVTTEVGHFNIFPVPAGDKVPDYKGKDWKAVFASIADTTGAKVVILNHPRDLHSGYRPFGPKHHNALIGENLDGWKPLANGMEVINSGAQQTDFMRPFHDWFALLNRGLFLTPVGASDSHDVARFLIGQARTYIRSTSDDPGKIDVDEAVANFLQGRVLVSCGLLIEITVNGKYVAGDLVPPSDTVKVNVRVLGPSWVTVDRVELYANGYKIREAKIGPGQKAPVHWQGEWTLPAFRHDVHLMAIASGPGVRELYWPIAKPYQATSPHVDRRVIGAAGAVWMDADGDGKRTCAYEYAQRLAKAAGPSVPQLVQSLADYDEAVAVQVAALLQARGISVQDPAVRQAAGKAGAHVQRGFAAYFEAWRECQIARQGTS